MVRRIKGLRPPPGAGKSKFFYEVTPEGIRNLRNINETTDGLVRAFGRLPEKGQ